MSCWYLVLNQVIFWGLEASFPLTLWFEFLYLGHHLFYILYGLLYVQGRENRPTVSPCIIPDAWKTGVFPISGWRSSKKGQGWRQTKHNDPLVVANWLDHYPNSVAFSHDVPTVLHRCGLSDFNSTFVTVYLFIKILNGINYLFTSKSVLP